jgi:hypothetical protein
VPAIPPDILGVCTSSEDLEVQQRTDDWAIGQRSIAKTQGDIFFVYQPAQLLVNRLDGHGSAEELHDPRVPRHVADVFA